MFSDNFDSNKKWLKKLILNMEEISRLFPKKLFK